MRFPHRPGFTLIELLVVIAIIAVLIGLLLPAVQMVRDAANRTKCANNLRQVGLALVNYENTYNLLPPGGQGLSITRPYQLEFSAHSVFVHILPFIEQDNIAKRMDLRYAYNETPANRAAAQAVIKVYLCPTDPLRRTDADSQGYGAIDYGATFHCNINPATGRPDSAFLTPGALGTKGTRLAEINDGTSTTIAIAEDVGRHEGMRSLYPDPVEGGMRKHWRWADPDNAFGVSFTPNYHRTPWGGPPECPWIEMNCGANDELFSFHPGGTHVVFCDGHITFLRDRVSAATLRALVSRSEGDLPGSDY